MLRKVLSSLVVLVMVVVGNVFSANLTGEQIMRKVDNRYKGDDGIAKIKMSIIDKVGKTRVRKLVNYVKKYGKNDKILIKVTYPADVKGTALMTWQKDGDDDQWLYLPAIRKIRRISSSNKGQSFLGSDFSYEDLSGADVDEFNHKLLKEEKYNNWDCYVVESTPKNLDDHQYKKVVQWVDKQTFIPVKIECYDKEDGKLLKIGTVEKMKKIQNIDTVVKITMENVKKHTKTILELSDIKYNQKLSDRTFSKRNMRK